jgi:Putative restriction endonuclease
MPWEVKQMLAEDRPKTRESLTMPVITWEKLPENIILPEDPVVNLDQPWIAAAITESLILEELVPENAFTCSNYGIISMVDEQIIAKAPDWAYIANSTATIEEINNSYTPHLQGEVPTIVLEFLSETGGTEYSMRPKNPMGKWFYYQLVLKVPYYGIFDPISGDFKVYRLGEFGVYHRLPFEESDEEFDRYWIEPMKLSIAAWKGKRQNRMGYWLRWWDADGNMLPWATEKVAQERQRANEEHQRADRLAQRLKELGLDPE